MKFFHFRQNNSGGNFISNDNVTNNVIVEAIDSESACRKAEAIGIYFDGCDNGMDCPCCGDRWDRPWKDDGTEEAKVYGKDPKVHLELFKEGPYKCIIYRHDGSIERIEHGCPEEEVMES